MSDSPEEATLELTGAAPRPVLIEFMPQVRSRFELPADYYRARELWERGHTLYGRGKDADAARAFLEVARLCRFGVETTYAEEVADIRRRAYENAVTAFLSAGLHDDADRALADALAHDEENAQRIEELRAEVRAKR